MFFSSRDNVSSSSVKREKNFLFRRLERLVGFHLGNANNETSKLWLSYVVVCSLFFNRRRNFRHIARLDDAKFKAYS